MIAGFRTCTHTQEITSIKGQTVECVQSYECLGAIIDSNFETNCEAMWGEKGIGGCRSRKISHFHSDKSMLMLSDCAFIETFVFFLSVMD